LSTPDQHALLSMLLSALGVDASPVPSPETAARAFMGAITRAQNENRPAAAKEAMDIVRPLFGPLDAPQDAPTADVQVDVQAMGRAFLDAVAARVEGAPKEELDTTDPEFVAAAVAYLRSMPGEDLASRATELAHAHARRTSRSADPEHKPEPEPEPEPTGRTLNEAVAALPGHSNKAKNDAAQRVGELRAHLTALQAEFPGLSKATITDAMERERSANRNRGWRKAEIEAL
jgi:hypothetical protein